MPIASKILVRAFGLGLVLSATSPLLPHIVGPTAQITTGAAFAQTREERKVQSILKKAASLEAKIEGHESGEKKFTDRTIATLAKQVLRIDEQIKEYEDIAGYDEAVAVIADLSARLEGLEAQLAKALEATGGLSERDYDKQIQNAERLLQQAERLIKDADNLNWDSVTDDRRAAKLEKTLGQIDEKAAEILEIIPGHAEMMAEIEKARQITSDVRARTDALLSNREGAKDRLIGYFQSGKSTEDSLFVYELGSWSYEVAKMMDQQTKELIFWNGMSEAELYKSWAARLDSDRARLASIQEDYSGISGPLLSEVSQEMEPTLGEPARQIGGLNNVVRGQLENIEQAFALVEALRENGVERTRARIAEADAEMQRLETELAYDDLRVGHSITQPMVYGEALLVVLDGYASDVDDIKATVSADMDGAKQRLQDTVDRVYNQIVVTNDVPSHSYNGSEADALIAQGNALFADVFKGEKQGVGAFIPDTDWYRDVGEKVVNNTIQKYDESRLFVTVFATEPNDMLSKWSFMVTKDHLNGDRISFDVLERGYENPISPYRVYPKDSITGLR